MQRIAGALRAGGAARVGSPCWSNLCARERCPFAVVGTATAERNSSSLRIRWTETARSTCRCRCCSARPPRMQRSTRACADRVRAVRCRRSIDIARCRSTRVLRLPGVAAQEFPHHDRRSHRRRPDRARPDGRPLAGAGGRLRSDRYRLRGHHRRGHEHGRAPAAGAARRAGLRPHGGGRGAHQHRRRAHRQALRRAPVRQLDGRLRPGRRGRAPVRYRACRRRGVVSGTWHRDPGRQGFAVDEDRLDAERPGPDANRAAVAGGLGVRAGGRCARQPDAAAAHRRRRYAPAAGGSGQRPQSSGRLPRWRRFTGRSFSGTPDLEDAEQLKAAFELVQSSTQDGRVLAYHDRSDGGLFVDGLRDGIRRTLRREHPSGIARCLAGGGAVQRRTRAWCCRCVPPMPSPSWRLRDDAGLRAHEIGAPTTDDQVRFSSAGRESFTQSREQLQKIWSQTSYRIARLRDNPDCAEEEFASAGAQDDPGLGVALSFTPAAFPFSISWVATQAWRSCASRVSTARSKWPMPSTPPALNRWTCT